VEIPVEEVQADKPELVINRSNVWAKEWRPNAKLRSVSNYPYNCVGLVFAHRRAWIDIDYIYKLLTNDKYVPTDRSKVMPGDVVLYKNNDMPTHVGLILEVPLLAAQASWNDIKVLSKWGYDGEFIHPIEHVPSVCGKAEEFWTERVTE
jgi:hypothetical protein